MALEMELRLEYGSPQYVVQGYVISRPEVEELFLSNSVFVTLRGVSTTKVVAQVLSEKKLLESSVTFLERTVDIYDNEVYDHPISLHDGCRSSFHIPIPMDATHQNVQKIDYRVPFHDTVEPQSLPPSGRFGHDNSISYHVEAKIFDLNSSKEFKISKPIPFTSTRDVKQATAKGIELSQYMLLHQEHAITEIKTLQFSVTLPTVYVPGYPFPIGLRLLRESSFTPIIWFKGGSAKLLEHTTITSTCGHSKTWNNEHLFAACDNLLFEPDGLVQVYVHERLDVAALLGHPATPTELAPSFACQNIRRSYGIALSLGFECGNRSYNLDFVIDRITLLPRDHHDYALAWARYKGWGNADGDTLPSCPTPIGFSYDTLASTE